MKLFRKLVCAKDIADYVSAYTVLFESIITNKHFEGLCNISERWARCLRNDELIRRSNANNFVEAQFLVIKESLLKRQRQFNINMLFDNVISEFEDHYKRCLLSVADGTFDGVYSQGFKGTNCKSN